MKATHDHFRSPRSTKIALVASVSALSELWDFLWFHKPTLPANSAVGVATKSPIFIKVPIMTLRLVAKVGAVAVLVCLACLVTPQAQPQEANYHEAKVRPSTLPDPLVLEDGTKVTDSSVWIKRRRPQILQLFETQVYGKMPGKPTQMSYQELDLDPNALSGTATRKQVRVKFNGGSAAASMDILIYLPNA